MAVKASVTITISKYRDTDSITRYYKLQASTAAAPAVPTTLTPSGWSTSEPTYTSGSTNTLYYTDCIVFSDGTFQYTDDGNGKAVKSSSYEAAKEAYNKAQAAQNTANTANTAATNITDRVNDKENHYNFKYYLDVVVYGDSNKFYPVIIKYGDQDTKRTIMVKRGYAEQAPSDWNKSTHPGALVLKILCNFGGWGGANYSWEIHELEEMYSQIFGGAINCGNNCMFAIFLRGGGTTGAKYHLYSDMKLDQKGAYDYGWDEEQQLYVINKLPSPQISYRTNYIQYKSDLCFGYPGNKTPVSTGKYEDLQYKTDAPAPRDMVANGTTDGGFTRYVRTSAQNEEIRIRKFIKLSQDNDTILKKTVKKVDVEYYLSTSSTECSGGSWSTTAPAWVDGKYMWSRQKVTFVDNTTSTTNTTCIAGAKGSTGSTGTGINSITEEYYLSTSKTTQTGGSWDTNPPTWESGKYIWTRSKIVYKNPASTAYTTPLCSSEWEAVNELDIGGKNLLLDSKKETLNKTSYLVQRYTLSEDWIVGDEYTLSIKGNVESGQFGAWRDNGSRGITYNMNYNEEKNLWWYTFKCPEPWNETNPKNILSIYNTPDSTTHNSSIEWIKLEKGNKPTDWTPAPEDTDEAIETVSAYAQNVANELLTTKGQLTAASTRIDSLQGVIENFVKDDNGMVTVTQTGSGMQIDMTQATNRINQLLTAIESAVTEGEANQLRTELLAAIQAVQSRTAYINATQDAQGRPVITLGATDSPFKVEITNEAINFIQNGQVIAYANGQKFYNLRTVVQQDVQIGIGPGFIWKTRDSGNMGLTWVPAQS